MCTGIRNSLSGDRDSRASAVVRLAPIAGPPMKLSDLMPASHVPMSFCEPVERKPAAAF
jgi:hypothetical protein